LVTKGSTGNMPQNRPGSLQWNPCHFINNRSLYHIMSLSYRTKNCRRSDDILVPCSDYLPIYQSLPSLHCCSSQCKFSVFTIYGCGTL